MYKWAQDFVNGNMSQFTSTFVVNLSWWVVRIGRFDQWNIRRQLRNAYADQRGNYPFLWRSCTDCGHQSRGIHRPVTGSNGTIGFLLIVFRTLEICSLKILRFLYFSWVSLMMYLWCKLYIVLLSLRLIWIFFFNIATFLRFLVNFKIHSELWILFNPS